MTPPPAAIWSAPWPDAPRAIRHMLDHALDAAPGGHATVWFRADDVGVPGQSYGVMADCFVHHGVPLSPALVPAWLTRPRWTALLKRGAQDWGWHQHGWMHTNHERTGRKCEFGPSRPAGASAQDIHKGATRLHAIAGDALHPVFTPPWNRLDSRALAALEECGLRAVSRNIGARPQAPALLAELPIHIDLHTRRAPNVAADQGRLLAETDDALRTGLCGFMLHHQRMNRHAADFLGHLLTAVGAHERIATVHAGHLLKQTTAQT